MPVLLLRFTTLGWEAKPPRAQDGCVMGEGQGRQRVGQEVTRQGLRRRMLATFAAIAARGPEAIPIRPRRD